MQALPSFRAHRGSALQLPDIALSSMLLQDSGITCPRCVLVTADVSLVRLWQSVILRASGASWIPDILSCFLCGNHPNGEICAVEEGGLVSVSKQDLIDNWEWVRHLSGLLASYWFYCMDFSLKCFKERPQNRKALFHYSQPSLAGSTK